MAHDQDIDVPLSPEQGPFKSAVSSLRMTPRSPLRRPFQALAPFWTRTTSTAYVASYHLPVLPLELAWVSYIGTSLSGTIGSQNLDFIHLKASLSAEDLFFKGAVIWSRERSGMAETRETTAAQQDVTFDQPSNWKQSTAVGISYANIPPEL